MLLLLPSPLPLGLATPLPQSSHLLLIRYIAVCIVVATHIVWAPSRSCLPHVQFDSIVVPTTATTTVFTDCMPPLCPDYPQPCCCRLLQHGAQHCYLRLQFDLLLWLPLRVCDPTPNSHSSCIAPFGLQLHNSICSQLCHSIRRQFRYSISHMFSLGCAYVILQVSSLCMNDSGDDLTFLVQGWIGLVDQFQYCHD